MRAAEDGRRLMASYHCQVKVISRGAGRSATAAAAYRAGTRIECEREGRTHDYTRKRGVEASFIRAPSDAPAWVQDRAQLWNRAEAAETRSNSRTAREWEVALPYELTAEQRRELADSYARALVDRYGAAVDVAIHAPHREGDRRNHHAHIMVTTRKIGREGFGAKTRILDDRTSGPREVEVTRALWADMQNDRLERAGASERVDHRSLEAQRRNAANREDRDAAVELDRAPEVHMGPQVAAIERRERRQAEARAEDYQPVTERGQRVYDARQARRTLMERLGAVRDALRDRVQLARDALTRIGRPRDERAAAEALRNLRGGGPAMSEEDRDRPPEGATPPSMPTMEQDRPRPFERREQSPGEKKMIALDKERMAEAKANSDRVIADRQRRQDLSARDQIAKLKRERDTRVQDKEKARRSSINKQGQEKQAGRKDQADARERGGKEREDARQRSGSERPPVNRELPSPTRELVPPWVEQARQAQAREILEKIKEDRERPLEQGRSKNKGRDWER